MRDYLFRGKHAWGDSYGWIYGSLIHAGTYCCILDPDDEDDMDYPYLDDDLGTIDGRATPVIPDTVGEWTGLFDKNGKRIFEGDVVQDEYEKVAIVSWYNGRYYPFIAFPEYLAWSEGRCTVIGNIHDNREFVKGAIVND